MAQQQQLVRTAMLPASSRLAVAMANFEADLSTEQKLGVHEAKKHAPQVDDVIRLTAEIDQALATKSSRCYGPRVHTFLQGIQQFASIGDVLVGGSQNLIACGVWSIVRFSLLAATKYTRLAAKLSEILMSLSCTAPRFTDIAGLYANSKPVQDSLFEYYIVVIRLCHEILRLSKKSTIGTILAGFGHTLESCTTDLNQKAKNLKTELDLEANKEANRENQRNASFRALTIRNWRSQKLSRQRTSKRRILDACSIHDYQTTWKQAKKIGTTSLFKTEDSYEQWLQSKTSSTLLYHGKLGFGKSVILANIVNDLHIEHKKNTIYFFCRHDIRDSLYARTIAGCLARQLLQQHPSLDFLAEETAVDLESRFFDVDELLDLIGASVSGQIYCVIDGLDDCDTDQRRAAMQILGHLQKTLQLSLCVATRFEDNDLSRTHAQEGLVVLHATIPTINPDLQRYVNLEIDARVSEGDLHASEALVPEIKEQLIEQSQGMFLWVYLQIKSLCLMESDHDIKAALLDLPQGLAEVYSRLLQQYDESQYRRNALELILGAFRPLTKEELREALSVEPGNTEYDPAKRVHSVDRILQSCGGLVVIDEEEHTARLVHSSTQQFLTTDVKNPIKYEIANRKLLEIILTYLNYSLVGSQLSRNVNHDIPTASIPAAIIISMVPIARKFVKPLASRGADDIVRNIVMPDGGLQEELGNYARTYWIKHLVQYDPTTTHLQMLRNALTIKRVSIHEIGDDGLTPLQLGARAGQFDLVKLLLGFFPDQQDKQKAALLAAISDARVARTLVTLLVDHMAQDLHLDSLLFEALGSDVGVLVSILLQKNRVSKNPTNKHDESPAMFSLNRNKLPMMRILVANELILPRQAKRLVERALLIDMLEMMRELALSKTIKDVYGSKDETTKLWLRIIKNYQVSMDMVGVLLDSYFITASDNCGESGDATPRTPLMVAAAAGRADVVVVLLSSRGMSEARINATVVRKERFVGPRQTAVDLAKSETVRALLIKAGGLTAEELNQRSLEDS